MPKWSNDPPPADTIVTLPIRRCPTNGFLSGWITSDFVVGCEVHWYKNRTYPCEETDCPACRNKVPARWKGYVGAWLLTEEIHVMLEFPPAVGRNFTGFMKRFSTLRSARFELRRIPNKPNGKVHSKINVSNQQSPTLPAAPNIIQMLAVLWDIRVLPGNDPKNVWAQNRALAASNPEDPNDDLPAPDN